MFNFVKNAAYFFLLYGSAKSDRRPYFSAFSAGIPEVVVLTGENFGMAYLYIDRFSLNLLKKIQTLRLFPLTGQNEMHDKEDISG